MRKGDIEIGSCRKVELATLADHPQRGVKVATLSRCPGAVEARGSQWSVGSGSPPRRVVGDVAVRTEGPCGTGTVTVQRCTPLLPAEESGGSGA